MTQTIIPTKQLPVVTEIDDPGSDITIPTEQAVREAISDITAPVKVISAGAKLYIYNNCW